MTEARGRNIHGGVRCCTDRRQTGGRVEYRVRPPLPTHRYSNKLSCRGKKKYSGKLSSNIRNWAVVKVRNVLILTLWQLFTFIPQLNFQQRRSEKLRLETQLNYSGNRGCLPILQQWLNFKSPLHSSKGYLFSEARTTLKIWTSIQNQTTVRMEDVYNVHQPCIYLHLKGVTMLEKAHLTSLSSSIVPSRHTWPLHLLTIHTQFHNPYLYDTNFPCNFFPLGKLNPSPTTSSSVFHFITAHF